MIGEYWIDNVSQTWEVSGSGEDNHESLVLRYAASELLSDLGCEDEDEDVDITTLRASIQCKNLEDYLSQTFLPKAQAKALWGILFGQGDPRLYALKYWGWIWVHPNTIGIYTADMETLKRAKDGLETILTEEGYDDDKIDNYPVCVNVQTTNYSYELRVSTLNHKHMVGNRIPMAFSVSPIV